MFRLQYNVPENYINGSRDFQLLCRLYDCVNIGVKNDIDSMIDLLDAARIQDNFLSLLATKVGFFTKSNFNANIFRSILGAFPYIMKYKGTKYGISLAVCTILKAEGQVEPPVVYVDNDNYSVNIYISSPLHTYNKKALDELLSYVLPIGYTYQVATYSQYGGTTKIGGSNILDGFVGPQINVSQVRGSDRILGNGNDFNFTTELQDSTVGTYYTTTIIGSETFQTDDTLSTDRLGTDRDTVDENSNLDTIAQGDDK